MQITSRTGKAEAVVEEEVEEEEEAVVEVEVEAEAKIFNLMLNDQIVPPKSCLMIPIRTWTHKICLSIGSICVKEPESRHCKLAVDTPSDMLLRLTDLDS